MNAPARTLLAALALAAAGCSTTAGLSAQETRSGFDGARVVDIAPHGLACSGMTCLSLGAQWASTSPDAAIITARLTGKYVGLRALELNIDGQRVTLQPAGMPTRLEGAGLTQRESAQDYRTTLATVRSLTTAQRVWVRVQTLDGSMEWALVDGATDSKAVHAMRRFLAQVDQR